MPIYGYVCQGCEYTLDALQKIADAPLTDCPECGEAALKRQLSAPRFRLKGGGWYETDFKTDNQRNLAGDKEAAAGDGKGKGKGKGKGEGEGDSKGDGKGGGDKADAKTDGKDKKADTGTAKPAAKSAAKPATGGGNTAKSA